jgi:hypothetical protein
MATKRRKKKVVKRSFIGECIDRLGSSVSLLEAERICGSLAKMRRPKGYKRKTARQRSAAFRAAIRKAPKRARGHARRRP